VSTLEKNTTIDADNQFVRPPRTYSDDCVEDLWEIAEFQLLVGQIEAQSLTRLRIIHERVQRLLRERGTFPSERPETYHNGTTHEHEQRATSSIAIKADEYLYPEEQQREVQNLSDDAVNLTIQHAIETIVNGLRNKRGVKQPTKAERLLRLLKQSNQSPVAKTDLVHLFSANRDTEAQLRRGIQVLNEKLIRFGLRISHITAYRIETIAQDAEQDQSS
jgi:hypothetical protein